MRDAKRAVKVYQAVRGAVQWPLPAQALHLRHASVAVQHEQAPRLQHGEDRFDLRPESATPPSPMRISID
ncbi:hypothetical protein ACU4GD_03425 [Cupriavidus basilensis]